jgi:hypothetical protein
VIAHPANHRAGISHRLDWRDRLLIGETVLSRYPNQPKPAK